MLLGAVAGLGLSVDSLYGQSALEGPPDESAVEWRLLVDGEPAEWPGELPTASLSRVRDVGRRVVEQFQEDGYYYARLDSASVDTSSSTPEVRLHVRRGPQVHIGRLQITGADAVPVSDLRRLMDVGEGSVFDSDMLDADIQAMLDRYEEIGRPLAQIRVSEAVVDTGSSPQLHLTLAIDEGPELWLKRVAVPDGARTSSGLVARLADLTVGAPLTDYEPEAIRTALESRPYFESVGTPTLQVTADGGAIIDVPIDETEPGAFDVALGYLPPSGPRDGGQIVGSGHLLLENLFGGGRQVDLTLDRRPGQTSLFDVSVSDPYIFGLPFRVTGQFEGEQRDSTYGERSYGLRAGYRVSRAFTLAGRVSREVVNPGYAGRQLREGRQHIPRGRTLFYGVGVQYESIDRRINPRRGLLLDARVDRGQKRRSFRRITASGDTTRQRESIRQERFEGSMRAFVPLFERQVVVVGGDAAVVRSRTYDRSDLFRFGGATSLRGYDEDRFLGNVTVRGLAEYRLQLDRRSYAYVFGDLGYVQRPPLAGSPETGVWHPGYGVGIQLSTGIGLITTTYALNPEVATPASGRIHVGLSVGL